MHVPHLRELPPPVFPPDQERDLIDPHPEPWLAPAEFQVTRLLADGLLADALEQVGSLAPSAFTDVVSVDVRSRRIETSLAELQELQGRLRSDPVADARFGPWAAAVLAERMLLDGDVAAACWAATLLADVTEEPFPPVPVLFARARLRRLAALGLLFEPSPGGDAAFRSYRDGALEDFGRCGFAIEAAVTIALTAGARVILTQDDPEHNRERVREARAALDGVPLSAWRPVLDMVDGMASLQTGDIDGATRAFASAAREPTHPLATAVAAFGQAAIDMLRREADASTLPAVDDALDAVRRLTPRNVPTLQSLTANVLADFGRTEMSGYARPVFDAPLLGPASTAGEWLLSLRSELVAGTAPVLEGVLATLTQLAELQGPGIAGTTALRLARDYERLGRPAEADALRQWSAARLPPPAEGHTSWMQVLGEPAASSLDAPSGTDAPADPTTVVRVLSPTLVLVVDGRPRPLRTTVAKLLLALVVRHPRPLHHEEVAELIWPDDAHPRTVRTRLNTLVYRLRVASPALGAAVHRTGDLLAFVGGDCRVDLLTYRRVMATPGADRVAALAGVRGNLCDAQFPYDDLLVDERRTFAAGWLAEARELTATGGFPAIALAEAVAALRLDAGDLATPSRR